MTRKKMLPLALLAAVVVLLAVLLAALHSAAEEEELPGIALCPLTAAELNTVSYSGEKVEVTLQKGSGGTWRLASDPSLPLDQDDVAALVEQYAALRADRRLQGDELAEDEREDEEGHHVDDRLGHHPHDVIHRPHRAHDQAVDDAHEHEVGEDDEHDRRQQRRLREEAAVLVPPW